ncbi:DUF4260 domain-containing protein [Zhouia sp. PK063]|uniref:DUF4260 domain-containing protein n=1 Tax=Zhouia sp. PK063 TaxID=3373602 RepID=UPI003790A6CE
MKFQLQLEEAFMLALGIIAFSTLNISWWWFAGLFLAPDIGMIGYMINTKVGAYGYNIFHNKAIAIAFFITGIYTNHLIMQFVGILLFSHSSFDRMFGFGLKYNSGFKDTHLGKLP